VTDSATFTTPEASDEEELGEDLGILGDLLTSLGTEEQSVLKKGSVKPSRNQMQRFPVLSESENYRVTGNLMRRKILIYKAPTMYEGYDHLHILKYCHYDESRRIPITPKFYNYKHIS
jgi:hypothetical protein